MRGKPKFETSERQTYYWLHVPTGKSGSSFLYDADATKHYLLSLIDRWSSQQPGVWVYSTYKLERPAPHTVAPNES